MIHPNTKLKHIDNLLGYGVFATEFIPKGTIIYVKDALEIEVTQEEYNQQSKIMKDAIEKYSYIDAMGKRVLSWDLGKYVNHCCEPNTMSTGYGFEIAISDIYQDQEITDEYGLFNLVDKMDICCGKTGCRKQLFPEDFETYFQVWDEKIKQVLPLIPLLDQPLYDLIDEATKEDLKEYYSNHQLYKSVYALRHK